MNLASNTGAPLGSHQLLVFLLQVGVLLVVATGLGVTAARP